MFHSVPAPCTVLGITLYWSMSLSQCFCNIDLNITTSLTLLPFMETSYDKFLRQLAYHLRCPVYRSCLASPSKKKSFMISMTFTITKNGKTPAVSY